MRKSFASICVAWICVLGSLPAATARAEDWPSRLIRATIPFGAGSATDVVPRLVFDRLAAELGQPIVIENRVGAGGTLGTALVAKADPDGYSILAHSSALTIAPAIFPNLTFDATRDLASVLMIGSSANVMIVPASRPWQSVQDFIADAKAKPGSISFGSVGIGSAVHISAEKFRLAAGIEATHVPYRGGAEVIADIIGGRIDFYFDTSDRLYFEPLTPEDVLEINLRHAPAPSSHQRDGAEAVLLCPFERLHTVRRVAAYAERQGEVAGLAIVLQLADENVLIGVVISQGSYPAHIVIE